MLLVINPYVKAVAIAAIQNSVSAFALTDKLSGTPTEGQIIKATSPYKSVGALTISMEPRTVVPRMELSDSLVASQTPPNADWLLPSQIGQKTDVLGTFWDLDAKQWSDNCLGTFYYSAREDTLLVESLALANLVSADPFSQICTVLLGDELGTNHTATLEALYSWMTADTESTGTYDPSLGNAQTLSYVRDNPKIWFELNKLFTQITNSQGYVSNSDNNSIVESSVLTYSLRQAQYVLAHPQDALASSVLFHAESQIGSVPTDKLGNILTLNGPITNSVNAPFSGSKSIWFDHNYVTGVSAKYMLLPSQNTLLNLGTGDFTLECWFLGLQTFYANYIVFQYGNFNVYQQGATYAASPSFTVLIQGNSSNSFVGFDIFDGQGYRQLKDLHGSLINNWNHFALVKYNGYMRFYINGALWHQGGITNITSVPVNTTAVQDTNNWNTPLGLFIGGTNGTGTIQRAMDCVRVTKAARYLTNFTPTVY